MNCTIHTEQAVNTCCDICHMPFCPGCLVDDRGRYVCQACFDAANPAQDPAEQAAIQRDVRTSVTMFTNRIVIIVGYVMVALGVLHMSRDFIKNVKGFELQQIWVFFKHNILIGILCVQVVLYNRRMDKPGNHELTQNGPVKRVRPLNKFEEAIYVIMICAIVVYVWWNVITTYVK